MTTANTEAIDSAVSFLVGGFDRNETPYLNRELSWMAFDARVLQLARDRHRPLLERVRFAAIFASNFDEFFQVRVAGLRDQEAAEFAGRTPDGRTPTEQLTAIRPIATRLCTELEDLVARDLIPALADEGIAIVSWDQLTDEDHTVLSRTFEEKILPVLTPLAVDPGHPFPYISDLSLNLAVTLRDPTVGRELFARLKVPPNLERFIHLQDGRLVPIEEVIAAHLPDLFVGMQIVDHQVFKVTRNADLSLDEDEAEDLLSAVEMELRRRRFTRAVRLEIQDSAGSGTRNLLLRELQLPEDALYECNTLLDLRSLAEIAELARPDLHQTSWIGVTEPELLVDGEKADLFAAIRRSDLLLHHPYSSFGQSVVELLHAASVDPDVLAIKMTLYRVSGDSPVVASLIRAAEAGKQVAVLIELTARFDEEPNINWARQLEQHGVHVTYGLVGLKTHAKCCLIVRQEDDGIRRYCHIGTGNYNDRTAQIYEDLGLLTADGAVGDDLARLFNSLTGYGREDRYQRLVVAPEFLRSQIRELIEGEMRAQKGHITMKMNALADQEMIDLLYDASQAGVQVDLIVRGICCLRPGVPNISENIRVRSIVGRYLEHSRVYHFANGDGPKRPAYYIGSADLMERNLGRRVETLVRIDDAQLTNRLSEILVTCLFDDRLAWDLNGDGVWTRRMGERGIDTHLRLAELATMRAEND
ncbi:MAG: polyphosphate kinase 1 [Actinomycetota bacterium]|nr:polyphosphate kinase 1 [Actinomycetota bacterium]